MGCGVEDACDDDELLVACGDAVLLEELDVDELEDDVLVDEASLARGVSAGAAWVQWPSRPWFGGRPLRRAPPVAPVAVPPTVESGPVNEPRSSEN